VRGFWAYDDWKKSAEIHGKENGKLRAGEGGAQAK